MLLIHRYENIIQRFLLLRFYENIYYKTLTAVLEILVLYFYNFFQNCKLNLNLLPLLKRINQTFSTNMNLSICIIM